MKNKVSLIVSCLAVISPFIVIAINLLLEPEIVESIFSGIILGCIVGTVLGVVALVLNKGKNKLIILLSVLPMIPLGFFLLLLIPFLFYKLKC